jgi:hypothetical protein
MYHNAYAVKTVTTKPTRIIDITDPLSVPVYFITFESIDEDAELTDDAIFFTESVAAPIGTGAGAGAGAFVSTWSLMDILCEFTYPSQRKFF